MAERARERRAKHPGPGAGQVTADGDGFVDGGQRLLPPPQLSQPVGLVVQRGGEVGQERVGPGQVPVGGDGFLDGGQRLLPPPQLSQLDGLVVQRGGEVGQERVGPGPPGPGRR